VVTAAVAAAAVQAQAAVAEELVLQEQAELAAMVAQAVLEQYLFTTKTMI
jgi:hypothetical protein